MDESYCDERLDLKRKRKEGKRHVRIWTKAREIRDDATYDQIDSILIVSSSDDHFTSSS